MASELVTKCDKCGVTPATHAEVAIDGTRFTVDLCDEHAEPLLELAPLGLPFAQVVPQRRGDDLHRHIIVPPNMPPIH